MPSKLAFALAVLLLAAGTWGESSRPSLTNGVISYRAGDGRRRDIQIGRRCADLWVAPDGSVIAFIAIEKAFPGTGNGPEPFIEESSVYVAWKADGFRPVRIDLKRIVLNGMSWKIVRSPSVSPDGKMLYFSVPFTMKDSKLFSVSLPNGDNRPLTDEVSYCVVWGGRYAGDLLLLRDIYVPVNQGLGCFLRDNAGAQTRIEDFDCVGFNEFAARWSREQGGTCTETPEGVDQ